MSDSLLLLEGAVRLATPLAFAAIGETVVERSGLINISLEGCIIAGALSGAVFGGYWGVWAGFSAAMVAGALIAAIFALFAVALRADQVITGTACNLLALGVTSTVFRSLQRSGGISSQIPTMPAVSVPVLSEIPIIGNAFFAQPPVFYTLYVLVPITIWWLYRTYGGLHLRAVGEASEAARAAGVRVGRIRWIAALFGGVLGGLSGGILVLAQTGAFVEGMSAGRGFIAIAIVALGGWSPLGALVAALIFGTASATQFYFQAQGWTLPYQLFLSLPYVLTLVALALAGRRSNAPRDLGKPEMSTDS